MVLAADARLLVAAERRVSPLVTDCAVPWAPRPSIRHSSSVDAFSGAHSGPPAGPSDDNEIKLVAAGARSESSLYAGLAATAVCSIFAGWSSAEEPHPTAKEPQMTVPDGLTVPTVLQVGSVPEGEVSQLLDWKIRQRHAGGIRSAKHREGFCSAVQVSRRTVSQSFGSRSVQQQEASATSLSSRPARSTSKRTRSLSSRQRKPISSQPTAQRASGNFSPTWLRASMRCYGHVDERWR